MKNNVQLITYVDRLTAGDFSQLQSLLNTKFDQLFSGVHLLPFYYPIDGSDAGFDPIDHLQVDSRLGNWQNIHILGEQYDLMADMIVNHISTQSDEFKDVLVHGKSSRFWDLFITEEKIFPEGLTEQQQAKIYRPRPGSCFSTYQLDNGEEIEFWTTFTRNQVDIDVNSTRGKKYLANILNKFSTNNIKIIRLDAVGYAIKKADSSCFMLPETFDFIDHLSKQANELGMATLVEIHAHYQTQIEIAKRVDKVYDFALPPLILHTLFSQNIKPLTTWLTMAPRNCITVLDTHDGIGIIDVGPDGNKAGLLTSDEIDVLVKNIHKNSNGESLQATGDAASNVDLYQVNCSYYAALAKDDHNYLLARAIQFFAPGTPQVYYAGLLVETNDMALLEKTNVGRDINRPYFTKEKITTALQKPVVKGLQQLIKLRNNSTAFNGEFTLNVNQQTFVLSWFLGEVSASLTINIEQHVANMMFKEGERAHTISIVDLLTKQ